MTVRFKFFIVYKYKKLESSLDYYFMFQSSEDFNVGHFECDLVNSVVFNNVQVVLFLWLYSWYISFRCIVAKTFPPSSFLSSAIDFFYKILSKRIIVWMFLIFSAVFECTSNLFWGLCLVTIFIWTLLRTFIWNEYSG